MIGDYKARWDAKREFSLDENLQFTTKEKNKWTSEEKITIKPQEIVDDT